MIVYIYNIGVDLYNGFNGLRHRINWTYFTVLDGLAHPLYSPTGCGLIKYGGSIVPFVNKMPKGLLYDLNTTKPGDKKMA